MLDVLREFGPDFNLALNVSKTTAFWPCTDSSALQNQGASVPINVTHEQGLVILGAPVGSTEFTRTR